MAFNHKRSTIGVWCLAAFIALLHGARQYVTGGRGHVSTVPPSLRTNDVRQLVTQHSEGSSNENIRPLSHSNGIGFLVGLTACAACMASVIPAANALEVDAMTSTTSPPLRSSKAKTSQPLRMPWDNDKNPLEQGLNSLTGANRMPWEKSPLEKVTDGITGNNLMPWEKSLVAKVTDQITGENLKPWERSLGQKMTDPITGANRKPWEKSPLEQAMRPVEDYLRPLDPDGKNRVPWEKNGVEQMTGAKASSEQTSDSLVIFAAVGAGLAATSVALPSDVLKQSTGKDKDSK